MANRVEHLAEGVSLYLGDCREILPTLGRFDAVVTDPPYSSGGTMRSDRNMETGNKYRLSGILKEGPDFSGDNRDQRSLTLWLSDWMAQCHAVTRKGGALLCFIDWRNLPCVIDAVQVGGWVYRGIVPWDKTEATRPNKGWFRAQVEYIVTASAGPLVQGADAPGIAQAGYIRCPVYGEEKEHITGKPVELMAEVLRTRDDWESVLDPFMGSGSTGVAAVKLGRKFTGIEIEEKYFSIACRRIGDALRQGDLFIEQPYAAPKPALLPGMQPMAICTQQAQFPDVRGPILETAAPGVAGFRLNLCRRVNVVNVQGARVGKPAFAALAAKRLDQRQPSLPVLGVLARPARAVGVCALALRRAKPNRTRLATLLARAVPRPSVGHVARLPAETASAIFEPVGVRGSGFAAMSARNVNARRTFLPHTDNISKFIEHPKPKQEAMSL